MSVPDRGLRHLNSHQIVRIFQPMVPLLLHCRLHLFLHLRLFRERRVCTLAAAGLLAMGCAGGALAQNQSNGLIDAQGLEHAARIVAGPGGRTLLVPGDAAYAVGGAQTPLAAASAGAPDPLLRVLRPGTMPIRHPATGTVLGHELRTIGTARLRLPESPAQPAVIDIMDAHEEVRVGDLLAPAP